MVLSGFPDRPVTLAELRGLHKSDEFIEAAPVNAIMDPNTDGPGFALDAVLVDEEHVYAVEYNWNTIQWEMSFKEQNAPPSEKDESGVVRDVVASARSHLENRVLRMEKVGEVGEIEDTKSLSEGQAVTREADSLTELIKNQHRKLTSED